MVFHNQVIYDFRERACRFLYRLPNGVTMINTNTDFLGDLRIAVEVLRVRKYDTLMYQVCIFLKKIKT
jgi:hypothetical protein